MVGYPKNVGITQNMFPKFSKFTPLLYGQNMVLKIGSSPTFINVTRDVPITHSWVYLVAPFTINGQNRALFG